MAIAEEKITEGKLIHFEDFTLNVQKRGLFRGEDRIRLTARPLETLIFLVEKRGQVAEKQEILDAVWKNTFVTEDVLVQAVKELRRVLGDDKDAPHFIQTVPRQGYRFIADTTVELAFPAPVLSGRPALAPVRVQVEPRSNFWSLVLLAALAGLLIVGTFIWFFSPTAAVPEASGPLTVNAELIRHFQTGEFPVGKPSFSPDGRLVLYVGSSRETSGFGDIFIMSATGGGSTRITERASPSGDLPVFTADGSHVVFSRPRGGEVESRLLDLYSVPTSGGDTRLYLSEASGAGFSTDGRWVAYTKHLPSHKVLRVGPTDNLDQYREIAAGGFTPRWSPDGKWLAYTTSDPNGGSGDIFVVNTATPHTSKNLTNELQEIYGLTWTADSRSIIFSSKRAGPSLLWMVSIDDASVRQVLTGVGESAAPSAGPDGSLVFHNARVVADLMVADLAHENSLQQITREEFHRWPRLSPSGEKIASVMGRPDFGDHLYFTDVRSGTATRLSEGPVRHPCWLDEANIAYLSPTQGAGTNVQVVNIASGVVAPLTQFADEAAWLAVNPDRRRIAVVLTAADMRQRIVVRDLESNTDELVSDGAEYSSLRWHPDGSALLWSGPAQASAPSSDGVWISEMATKQIRRIAPDGYGPVWNARSNVIYFSRAREFSGLWLIDPVSGISRKVRAWRELTAFDVVLSRLLFAQGEGRGQIYSVRLDR